MKESHDDSPNLHHDVYTTKISFNDEDLLYESKLHNQFFFYQRLHREKDGELYFGR
jgi:hypothetical protein